MKLAVVLVHYQTPELLADACRALVADARAHGLELEGLVVDNGSRPRDSELLSSLPFRLLDPGGNLGYAGGVNLGFRETAAGHVVVMNPDVVVLPGCLPALAEALESGAAAAGPRFYWDAGKTFLLPPTEEVSRGAELRRVLARRGGAWARSGRRAWRRHARRHWLAEEACRSFDLSGALLAIRRDAWARTGPFDEGYRLYFEETDWLRRLRDAGLEARFVPRAEAVHLYAQSAVHQDRAGAWFLESSRRFRRRCYGRIFSALLEPLSRFPGSRRVADRDGPTGAPGRAAWLEVSASGAGYPAAGRRFAPPALLAELGAGLPEEIRRRLAPGTYFLRAVSERGVDLAVERLEKP